MRALQRRRTASDNGRAGLLLALSRYRHHAGETEGGGVNLSEATRQHQAVIEHRRTMTEVGALTDSEAEELDREVAESERVVEVLWLEHVVAA